MLPLIAMFCVPFFFKDIFRGVPHEKNIIAWCSVITKRLRNTALERLEIIKLYNKSMGGGDLHDQLISNFRIFIKSRKWTLRKVTHSFDMACTNSWMEYRIDTNHFNTTKKK